MLELTPGLSVSLAPLVRAAGDVRKAVATAADAGFHSVQLSAATKGIRPRELDRRARRDVLAMLSRRGLMLAGLDLMIPHKDWLDPARQDRALAAALAAIDLAADWGKPPVSTTLPVERLDAELQQELLAAADGHGVLLAVHGEHDIPALRKWLEREDQPTLGAAVDPAALLSAGEDPAEVTAGLGRWVRLARLDDYANVSTLGSGGRCSVGDGELDVTAYRAALAACPKLRSVVLELRDVPDVLSAMQQGRQAWEAF